MNRHPMLGVLTIIASLPPLWISMGFILGFGVEPASWIFLVHAVPGAGALVAGLLLLTGRGASHGFAIVAWALLLLAAAFNLAMSWWSYAPGSVVPDGILLTEVLYVLTGGVVISLLARHQRHRASSHSEG